VRGGQKILNKLSDMLGIDSRGNALMIAVFSLETVRCLVRAAGPCEGYQ